MDVPCSDSLLERLRALVLLCLTRYAAYMDLWLQECLQPAYGWHNRIWIIYDTEIPTLITELVGLLGLRQKLFFAVMENGRIRLTEVLFSVDLHRLVWQMAFDSSPCPAEISSFIAKLNAACSELNEAISLLTSPDC